MQAILTITDDGGERTGDINKGNFFSKIDTEAEGKDNANKKGRVAVGTNKVYGLDKKGNGG